MRISIEILLVCVVLLGSVSAHARDLNKEYREYLRALPVDYYENKALEVERIPGMGSLQECGDYYAYYDEYVRFCKGYESADILRVYHCQKMAKRMKGGKTQTNPPCRPLLDKTIEQLNSEVLYLYEIAREKYSNHRFYGGILSEAQSTAVRMGKTEKIIQIIKERTGHSIRLIEGGIICPQEDSYLTTKGLEYLSASGNNSLNEKRVLVKDTLERMWRLCGYSLKLYYPDCRKELYLTLKQKGYEHLLSSKYREEGERLIKGMQPKTDTSQGKQGKKVLSPKPLPQPVKESQVPETKKQQPPKVSEPEQTPDQSSENPYLPWLYIAGILALLSALIASILVIRRSRGR